ncbi:Pollen Ole e 1 allergen and extensin family protein [Striga hermonthica]|uniref:Pollen Ole e 1 allergen and extensin family protein n=1 Tax=Striga hermonthica TaxID=68872 RepID=A0A9N7MXM4_STRHE|nr:Pollen Ole e 1 allergen and extensin family protein [Striga hermonthica]
MGYSHFDDFVIKSKMFFFAIIVLVFLERPAVAARKSDLLTDLFPAGRDEMVKWAGYGEDKLSTVVVGGKIICHGGGAIEKASHPVSGATVVVLCGSSTKRKKSWARTGTDDSGNFLIDLPSHLHAIPNLEKICHIKVVRLPKTSPCCPMRKHNSIKLTSNADGIRNYTTEDIHLKPHKRV